MRERQYASGLSSRTGTRSHISWLNQNYLIPVTRTLYLVRLIEKYFPIQLESLRARDSPEAPFSLVSRDISETVLNYSSVGQSVGLSILWSLFLFLWGRQFDSSKNSKTKTEYSNLHGFELHRPSRKDTKVLFQVIKAIVDQYSDFW